MTIRRIIPDAYTEYEDGHLGVIPASLANVEAKIGPADDGQPNKVYTLAGPDAKKQAKTIFQGGPLLRAIEAAFDAGSTRIHAVRIGTGVRSQIVLPGIDGSDTMRIRGPYGDAGNNHYLNVSQTFERIISGYAAVFGNPNRVVFYDEDMLITQEISLPPEIASVVGVEMPIIPDGPLEEAGFAVLGYATADGHPTIWNFTNSGALIPDRTLDLTPFLQLDETITGLVQAFDGPGGELAMTTDKRLYYIDTESSPPMVEDVWDYSSFGLLNPDISSAAFWIDLAAVMRGEDPEEIAFFLDRTARKIVAVLDERDAPPSLIGELSLDPWLDVDDVPEGISVDLDSGQVRVGLHNDVLGEDRILVLDVDWEATPEPTATLIETLSVPQNLQGLGYRIADAVVRTTITIQDRNVSPFVVRVYEAVGTMATATEYVADVINAGGIYSADLLTDPALWLMPSLEEGDGPPDPTRFDPFEDGEEGGEPINEDYLAGLEATKAKTDTAWIHAVGATTEALWTAVLLHCDEMAGDHQAERFAILETPEFESDYEEGSAEYLSDLQDYLDDIATRMAMVGDRNACVFAGGAVFLDSDGDEIDLPVTAACGGTMSGLEVQKSLINKPVRGVLRLVPEFSPGHIQSLIQARVNCLRFKPGRGFIIAHSLTAAAVGSDYSRVNDLRAVYYGSKAAREAGQPYVGEENDAAGEGLRRLESAMARPLEQMRDGGQIDAFDLSAVSTEADRLLGDVYVSLGIQPRRAMEMIYTTVYLK
jgi:hypothetical protein